MTYLTVVSVECLQLLDIVHVDALRQRLGAQVRRGKCRQGVGRIYVLLVVLALSSHGLLWSAVTVLRAPTQAVRHTVHFL